MSSAFGNGLHSLQRGRAVGETFRHVQISSVHTEVMLGVRPCGHKHLLHRKRAAVGDVFENGFCFFVIFPTNQSENGSHFIRGYSDVFRYGERTFFLVFSRSLRLFFIFVAIFLSSPYLEGVDVLAACPWKVLVGANSPSLQPIISSVIYTGTCLRPSYTAIV